MTALFTTSAASAAPCFFQFTKATAMPVRASFNMEDIRKFKNSDKGKNQNNF